ncbi:MULTISPECIES: hypothetical protein [Emticicia]|nr:MULTISPECIES: hypothetical protein [Emticicia]
MRKTLSILTLITTLMACSTTNNTQQQDTTKAEQSPPIVGNDTDEHGCKPSAGYQWSVLKNDCIRIFESGQRLDPVAAELEKSFSAFAVFKSDSAKEQVELFLVGEKASVILNKDAKTSLWKNDKYTLSQNKEVYTLEDANKKLLYKSGADK